MVTMVITHANLQMKRSNLVVFLHAWTFVPVHIERRTYYGVIISWNWQFLFEKVSYCNWIFSQFGYLQPVAKEHKCIASTHQQLIKQIANDINIQWLSPYGSLTTSSGSDLAVHDIGIHTAHLMFPIPCELHRIPRLTCKD